MQEHEYVYEHGYINNDEQTDAAMSDQERELAGEQVEIEDLDEIEESSASKHRRARLWLGRSLVLALILSFLACLAAFWLSGTLLSAPDHLLPVAFLQALAAQRVLVLIAPAVCLVICYAALRSLTSEIMSVPERYLDERQKMLRDQAHRSAFKVIKFACLLIPCGFLLPHLPWFNQPAPVPAPLTLQGGMLASQLIIHVASAGKGAIPGNFQVYSMYPITWRLQSVPPAIPSASTAEIVLAGALLLLGLFLIASALPMAVLAWKGKE